MKGSCALLIVLAGLCAPATAVEPLAAKGAAYEPTRDWPHDVKWDQLYPDTWGGHSTIDNDTPLYSTTADDWLCTWPSYLTDVHFAGWSAYGNQYITGFRLTVWSDVPATPDDESHPGDILWQYDAYTDWIDFGDGTFDVNIPQSLWFWQEGSPANPMIYWISIQGIMVDDGFSDTFYWNFKDRTMDTWGDDAAFESAYFGYAPWANWGWPSSDPGAGPDLYDGPFPPGWWKSADMAFALTFIPQPSSLLLLGAGGLLAGRRRR